MDTLSYQCQSIMYIKLPCSYLNPESNMKEVFPKVSMEISVRDLNNDKLKPF